MSSEQQESDSSTGSTADDTDNQDGREDRDPDAISLDDSGSEFDDENGFTDNEPEAETTEISTGGTSTGEDSQGESESSLSGNQPDAGQSVSTYNDGEIPHRVRTDSPREERIGLNVHVDQQDKHRLQELEQLADQEFGEKVYTIDVYLAALRSGLDDETKFLDEMKEIGYGWVSRQEN